MTIAPAMLRPDPTLASVRLLCCDVDGVLTDGGLYYGAQGEAQKRFHVLDGLGLKMLMQAGIAVCIVTQGSSRSISARARALGIDLCFTGVEDKSVPVRALMSERSLVAEQVAHIADDINDLSLLELAGIAVTVPNGVEAVRQVCQFVTRQSGGHGAVRELCDAILISRTEWPEMAAR